MHYSYNPYRDEVPYNKSVDAGNGQHHRPASQVAKVLDRVKYNSCKTSSYPTIFAKAGSFDSSTWVRLVTWVKRKNPEMKKVDQYRNDSSPTNK